MDNSISLDLNIVDEGQTIFNGLSNTVLPLNGLSAKDGIAFTSNGITLKSNIPEESCLFAPNTTQDYLCTDTTAGYYSSYQEVKEIPTNNQLSVQIRKKIKIRYKYLCSL